jgi:hypothetical protein
MGEDHEVPTGASAGPSRTARPRTVEAGFFLVIWFAFLIVGRSALLRDASGLWHLAVGERILETGWQVRVDPFSFTHPGEPWISYSWAAECAGAVARRVGGLDGVLVLTATLLAALYSWLAHRLLQSGLHPLLVVFLTALTIAASIYHFHARPHIATIAFLGWTYAALCDFDSGRIGLGRLFLLVPAFILWTNTHGGMLGGLGTLGLAVLGWIGAWAMAWPSPVRGFRDVGSLVLLLALCAGAMLINPFGLDLVETWLKVVGSPVVPRLMQEHGPLFGTPTLAALILALAALYVLGLFGVAPHNWRVSWLIPLAWLGMTVSRIRNGPLLAITASLALGELLPRAGWVAWLSARGSALLRIRPVTHPRPYPWSLPIAVLVVCGVVQGLGIQAPIVGRGWARPDPDRLPVALLPLLRQYEHEHPPGTPIFNEMLFGGFLIDYTPGLRVFIDDRCELYGDQGLQEYANALNHHPARIEEWADRYGFDAALVAPGSGFDRYLAHAAGWERVGRSVAANFYRRANHGAR